MAKELNKITPRDVDFAQWYTDVCMAANLVSYSGVKGSMILCPNGYAIWEEMQAILDREFKKLGHQNVQMPLFIPESLLNIEKEHVTGFAPEVAWVTYGGKEELLERLCVRPTSEVLFCDHYKNIISSYRDLPKLYNQWCTIVRWEKTTRPFLRSREILWQEGHTMHETKEEALEETKRMLHVYEKFQREYLALPVIVGRKTEKEKFAGAEQTYTVEAMMYDGVALQNGTSHYFGDHFAKAFGITFADRDNELKTPFQTSWGCTTRMIGAIIMTHGDDRGLVLPPKIAPTKVIFIPIGKDEEQKLLKTIETIQKHLEGISSSIDTSNKSPGFKFADAEVTGIPVRVEVGMRDLERGMVTLVRRDTLEKKEVAVDDAATEIKALLEEIQTDMYERALQRRNTMLYEAKNYEEFVEDAKKPGFTKINWCGNDSCETKIKDEFGLKSRCILEEEEADGPCPICGQKGLYKVYFGKQY